MKYSVLEAKAKVKRLLQWDLWSGAVFIRLAEPQACCGLNAPVPTARLAQSPTVTSTRCHQPQRHMPESILQTGPRCPQFAVAMRLTPLPASSARPRQSSRSHPCSQKCTLRPRRRRASGSLPNRKWRSPEFLPSCCVSRVMTGGAWAWITSYLLFPFFNFGHFALFHLFGLLLLLRFEGVGVREKAVEGREGNGVALSFVILVWKKKRNKDVICIEAHIVIARTPAGGFKSWRPFSWAWTTPHAQQKAQSTLTNDIWLDCWLIITVLIYGKTILHTGEQASSLATWQNSVT